jgi:hypothetical protein
MSWSLVLCGTPSLKIANDKCFMYDIADKIPNLERHLLPCDWRLYYVYSILIEI